MTEYTPTTEELRDAYRFHGRAVDDSRYKARGKPLMTDAEYDAEFDRWLDRVKAEAVREAADAFEGGTINVEVFGDSADAEYWRTVKRARSSLIASMRDRADRIERGESSE